MCVLSTVPFWSTVAGTSGWTVAKDYVAMSESENFDQSARRPAALGANARIVRGGAERLLVTGQIGIRPDGTLEKGLKAQLERAFINLFAVCEAAGFQKSSLVKITAMVTEPGRVLVFREVRDKALCGHRCPTAYVQVAGLSAPTLLCEIEAEAVRE